MALVHDFLCGMGGSERVFAAMCRAFPEADIFTLAYNPESTLPYFSQREIRTTLLDRFVRGHEAFKWAFVPATIAMSRLDLSGYDVVLVSSATIAKYCTGGEVNVGYLYYPTRAIWEPETYFASGMKGSVLSKVMPLLRSRDRRAARALHHIVTLSKASQRRISQWYQCTAEVLPSPIDLSRYRSSPDRDDYFLVVSRLDKWKELDHAIEAFGQIGARLLVVGDGPERERLESGATPNVEFLGRVPDSDLDELLSRARAVVFPTFLEYGLVPLEAVASGTPVICRDSPGVRETMVKVEPGRDAAQATAVFYEGASAGALVAAVEEFDGLTFDRGYLIRHAARFGEEEFGTRLRAILERVWNTKTCGRMTQEERSG